MTEFKWERGPFERCPNCAKNTMGILSVGGHRLKKRCSSCRFSQFLVLPSLKKKAIYLDQFMLSLIYNVHADGNLPKGHQSFAKKVYSLLRRCILLQQIFLPHSSIHHNETTVFHSAVELRSLYEFFGGDVLLDDVTDVELSQTLHIAEAYFDTKDPILSLDLGEITDSSRDDWLPDMHIGVRSDYGQFAGAIRDQRDEAYESMKELATTWRCKKPTFFEVLQHEFDSIGSTKRESLHRWYYDLPDSAPHTYLETINIVGSPIYREYRSICSLLTSRGIPQEEHTEQVLRFWRSKELTNAPHNRISCYLFAAIARRVIMGEKKIIDRGLVNDVTAISIYAPYVDAMFLDKKCASLLAEEPLATELSYKARIFSLNSGDTFIDFLEEIEANAPPEVKELSEYIYRIADT